MTTQVSGGGSGGGGGGGDVKALTHLTIPAATSLTFALDFATYTMFEIDLIGFSTAGALADTLKFATANGGAGNFCWSQNVLTNGVISFNSNGGDNSFNLGTFAANNSAKQSYLKMWLYQDQGMTARLDSNVTATAGDIAMSLTNGQATSAPPGVATTGTFTLLSGSTFSAGGFLNVWGYK